MIYNALSFVAVVQAGGFSKAAKNIGLSKAQLSRHASQLEAFLGIQLLYRTTRSIVLTEAGEKFFINCQNIEEEYQQAIGDVKQDFNALRGTLRITAPISYGSELFPEIIYKFNQKYPNIKILLSLTSTTEDLIEKNFDLSIRIAQSLANSSLRMRTLMPLNLVLCASPAYLEAHPALDTLDDLKNHKCITSINRSTELSKIYWSFYQNKKALTVAINSAIEVDSLRAQIQLITLGAGIGRVPDVFIKKDIQAGKLKIVLPNIKQPESYVYLLYPDRKKLPKKLEAFLEFIKELHEITIGG